MNKRGRPRGITASEDILAVVCLLKKLKWSNRRIGKLFHRDHTTVSDWYKEAYETIGTNFPTILVKSERGVKMMMPAGKPDDIAYIYSRVRQNPCGDGRQIKAHSYNHEWEDNQKRE